MKALALALLLSSQTTLTSTRTECANVANLYHAASMANARADKASLRLVAYQKENRALREHVRTIRRIEPDTPGWTWPAIAAALLAGAAVGFALR